MKKLVLTFEDEILDMSTCHIFNNQFDMEYWLNKQQYITKYTILDNIVSLKIANSWNTTAIITWAESHL